MAPANGPSWPARRRSRQQRDEREMQHAVMYHNISYGVQSRCGG